MQEKRTAESRGRHRPRDDSSGGSAATYCRDERRDSMDRQLLHRAWANGGTHPEPEEHRAARALVRRGLAVLQTRDNEGHEYWWLECTPKGEKELDR